MVGSADFTCFLFFAADAADTGKACAASVAGFCCWVFGFLFLFILPVSAEGSVAEAEADDVFKTSVRASDEALRLVPDLASLCCGCLAAGLSCCDWANGAGACASLLTVVCGLVDLPGADTAAGSGNFDLAFRACFSKKSAVLNLLPFTMPTNLSGVLCWQQVTC